MSDRRRMTFWIDEPQATALKAIKERDGVPEAEQIRRALAWWIEQKRLESEKTRPPKTRGKAGADG